MPPVVAAVGAAVTAYGTAHVVVQLLVRTAIGFAISAAASKLLGKPKGSTALLADPGRQESIRQALSPRRTLYGEPQAGGVIAYVQTTGGGNKYLSVLTMRAGHRIAGYEAFQFNDEHLTVSGDVVGGRYANRANVYTHLGADDQNADATMVADSGGLWTDQHALKGVAYEHFKLRYVSDETLWQDFNLSGIKARVRGKLVLDTRDSVTRYSANPALLLRDYLASRMLVADAEINDATISAAANICDEQVALVFTAKNFTGDPGTDVLTLAAQLDNMRRGNVVRLTTTGTLPGGLSPSTNYYVIPGAAPLTFKLATSFANAMAGTAILTNAGTGDHTLQLRSEPRYTAHGIVLDSDDPGDVVMGLLSAMAGTLTYSGGKFEIHAGSASTSSLSLDEDDLAGPIQLQPRRSRRELFNTVTPTYIDPDKAYQPTTAAPVTNSTYQDQDNGEPIVRALDLPFTDSAPRAQRLAKIELERCRQQMVLTYPVKLVGLQVKMWDVFDLTNVRFGWSAKLFRVIGWSLVQRGEAIGVDLTLAEEAAAMWDWSAEETEVDPAPDTNLPDYRVVTPPPEPITVTEEMRATATGTVVTVLTASVMPSSDQFTTRYRWEFRKTSDSAYVALPNTLASIEIPSVEDRVSYTIRVAAENDLGFLSDFISTAYIPIGQTEPPENVSAFSCNIIGAEAHLTWTAVGDIDLSHYRVRHSPLTTGATWGAAVDLVAKVSRPATSVAVPAMVGSYLIKAVDLRGNESIAATAISTTIAGVAGLNVVTTVTESPAFAGAHSDTVSVDGILKLAPTVTFDNIPGLFDSQVGTFDHGENSLALSGTYDFANGFDLGAVYTSRLTAALTVTATDGSPTFDGIDGLFDDQPGLFDGEVPANCAVSLEVRTTDDNPSGTPAWSEWRTFFVGDYRARAFEWRVILTSESPDTTPIVSALSVTVDMPDRVLAGAGTTSNSGDTTVTYASPFRAAPKVTYSVGNLATGDYPAITSETASGFTFNVYNAAASRVVRTFTYQANGYGVQA